MSEWRELLDATVAHLEQWKRAGITHVAVTPETLAGLALPAISPPPAMAMLSTGTVLPAAAAGVTGGAAPAVAEAGVDLEAVATRARACVKCGELARCRKSVVFGVGNPRAELMFIGEAPGADEDAQGEPFVGRAGQLLTKIIEAMGYRREEVYIANVLKCRPPNNRTPLPAEVENCLPYLREQIEAVGPKVMVALGATAVRALLDVQLGITKMRGQWFSYRDIPMMPTFHPAYLLRNPAAKREVWSDMKLVLAKLGRQPPPQVRR